MGTSLRRAGASIACALATALLLSVPFSAQGTGRSVESHRPVPALTTRQVTRGGDRLPSATSLAASQGKNSEAIPVGSAADWRWQNPTPTGNTLYDVRFVSQNVGWAVGGSDVFKTIDGGTQWVAQNVGDNTGLSHIDFVDADHGWASGFRKLTRTEDGGATWTSLNTGYDWSGPVSFVDTSTGFALGDGLTVKKTTDGGSTWSVQRLPGYSPYSFMGTVAIHFVDRNNGWVVGHSNIVYRTKDGGATWSEKMLYGYGDFLNSVDFIDTKVGWVAAGEAILKTTNGGDTWSFQTHPPTNERINSIKFVDASHGWATTEGGYSTGQILRTDDGGAHWSVVDVGEGESLYSCWFTDSEHGHVVGGDWSNNTCVLKTTSDGGKTWTSQVAGPKDDLWDVSATGTGTAVAAGADGRITTTADGGSTWTVRSSQTSETLWSLASLGATETWAVGNSGTIRHTTDGGATWEPQDAGTTAWLGSVSFVDPQHGWASGSEGTLLKTSDGGAHWTAVPTAPALDLYEVQFVDEQTGWVTAGDTDWALFKTTDGGASWTRQNPGVTVGISGVAFADAKHGWVAGGTGEIARTEDGGATWTTQYPRTGGWFHTIRAIDSSSAVALTNWAEIARTNDGGATWWSQVAPGQGFYGIGFANRDSGWVVGRSGLILNTTDGGGAQPAPATMLGTVRSAVTRQPLANVTVTLETYPSVKTDALGRYVINGIMPGRYYDMTCYLPGYAVGAPEYFSASLLPGITELQDDTYLRVNAKASLKSARVVGGRIVVSGAVTPARRAGAVVQYYRLKGKTYVRVRNVAVTTGSNGKFTYKRTMPKGTWRVRVSLPAQKGYTAAVSAWMTVRVR